MWNAYSKSYIRHNRASGRSVMAAALTAVMLLSLLHSFAYNLWKYEMNQIIVQEGDWQGRITGELTEEDVSLIRGFANVENVSVNEKLSEGREKTVDIYFKNPRRIFRDMPLIAEELGLPEDAVSCHQLLLSRYFIHDPADSSPPLLMSFYLVVLLMVSVSLILIIRNSFELSMQARIHQFGILSSIGATPGQIRICLLQEAAVLSLLPMLTGTAVGIAVSYGIIQVMNLYARDVSGRIDAGFVYHPLVFVVTVFSAGAVILFSAWIPAWKLSRMTPLEAIRNVGEHRLNRRKHSQILFRLFGIEGELAGNALKARKKSLRIASWSLFLSFPGLFGYALLCDPF